MLGARSFLLLMSACALAIVLFSPRAHGAPPTELEQRSITRALGAGAPVEPAPQGKRIESVEISRLPVFDDDDPVPD